MNPEVTPGNVIPWINDTTVDAVDVYFFAFGTDYRGALQTFTTIMGKIELPPLSAFGVWWSRYYRYSQEEFVEQVCTRVDGCVSAWGCRVFVSVAMLTRCLRQILDGYADHGLPLSHVVLDMDWHIEPTESDCTAWGGFTFNTALFPDPAAFISQLHKDGVALGHPLKLLLNVHPGPGVDHCQTNYPEFAAAMGVDPATKVRL